MLFDFHSFIEDLRENPSKKSIIEDYEKEYGLIAGNIEEQIWYNDYVSLFSLYYKPFKKPADLVNDFDWQVFFNLCCASFSSITQFVTPNKLKYDDDTIELEITVEHNGGITVKKVSKLWSFQILRLFEIYIEEQINLQTQFRRKNINSEAPINILEERVKRFTNIKNNGIKIINEDERQEQREELIYHYTTIENSLGIISLRSIWASDSKCLNDKNEIVVGYKLFDKVIDYIRKMEDFPLYENVLNLLVSKIDKKRSIEIFTASFSFDGDLLSQWRAYGDNGRGICIGFDKKMLLDFIYENAKEDETILNGDLDYDYKKLYVDTFQKIQGFIIEYETFKSKGKEIDTLIENVAEKIWFRLLDLKDSSFFEEKEFRLFFTQEPINRKKEIKFRNNIIPYVELNYNNSVSPIKTIKFGPTVQNLEMRERQFSLLLEKIGIDAKIEMSKIPYRI